MTDIIKAIEFAQRKHAGQVRKNGSDYFENHCMVVYRILKERTQDEATLCAGILHDTLEDTDTTYEELVEEFGEDVAEMVRLVTHTKDNVFPDLKFKNHEYDKLVHNAFMIKLADTFSNCTEMYSWSDEHKVKYLNKKIAWDTKPFDYWLDALVGILLLFDDGKADLRLATLMIKATLKEILEPR